MAEEKFDWNQLEEAKKALVKRAEALKQSFVQMPGGVPADPAAGGAPADPAAGGAPVDPATGAPVDPAAAAAGAAGAAGAPVDPAAAMDPAMLAAMGGAPMGVDAATAGMLGGAVPPDAGAGAAVAGAGGAGTPEPTITITLSQLWEVVKKVLGLAKQIGANGQGVAADGTPAPAPAPAAGQDAIKAAVIEALGDMGLTR